jgi:squalene-associated FAD-dependent desaturase
MSAERRVIVIGGGLAGITAALDCARAGAPVTLLEARGRLGGAAYSFTRDGIQADNGQHVFLRCCSAYRELLEALGATDSVTLQDRLEIPVLAPGRRRARLWRSGLPAPLHLAAALARYPLLSLRERARVARAMRALGSVEIDDPATDARSFGDWLHEQRQSERAIEAIWSLIVRPTLNLEPADASLAQAAQVFQVGLLSDRGAGDIGYARVPLSEIHDRAAMAGLREAGVDVRLRAGVTGILATSDGFRVERSGAPTLSSGAVIMAVQPDRLARLIPAAAGIDRAALTGLGSSAIVNLHFVFDRRVTELPFAAGVGTPVQWVFDRTDSAGLEHGQYLAITLSAAGAELSMTSDELRQRYHAALAELLPEVQNATVENFFVTREHAATFRAAPGARALRPGPQTQLPGLVLAGAWTNTGWPATMEGAVRSGHAAADQALSPLARDARPSPESANANGNGNGNGNGHRPAIAPPTESAAPLDQASELIAGGSG